MKPNQEFRLICVFLVLLLLNACTSGDRVHAADEDRNKNSFSPAEEEFTKQVTQMHLAEIEMARLAQQKSDDQDLQKYADMIIKDHMSSLVDLTDLTKDKNIPQEKSLSPETQRDINRMSLLTGPDFDREFANMMVSDHQKAILLFRDESKTAQNPDLKSYVDGMLPKLEKHLLKGQELQSRLFDRG